MGSIQAVSPMAANVLSPKPAHKVCISLGNVRLWQTSNSATSVPLMPNPKSAIETVR